MAATPTLAAQRLTLVKPDPRTSTLRAAGLMKRYFQLLRQYPPELLADEAAPRPAPQDSQALKEMADSAYKTSE